MMQPTGCRFIIFAFAAIIPACRSTRAASEIRDRTLYGIQADSPKVEQIRQKLRVVAASKGLSPELTNEAKHVLNEADQAVEHPKSGPTPDAVVQDYKAFVNHLLHRSEELTKKDKTLSPEEMTQAERDAKAAELVPVLTDKVQKLLLHISQEKGLNQSQAAARDVVQKTMRSALADANSTSVDSIHRAVELHQAMVDARDYVMQRSKDLDAESAKLGKEITEGTERMLLGMLMQRRKLPMPSQLAILKRRQFKNCTVAKELLKKHDKTPLFDQLMAKLPENVVNEFKKAHVQQSAGHLAAAGSGGRVQVVSSRLKNQVQMMIAQLKAARNKLSHLGKTRVGEEAAQAKKIVAGLDDMLTKVENTKDLKSQLEMMDQVEGLLGKMAADATVATGNSTATKATAAKAKKALLKSK